MKLLFVIPDDDRKITNQYRQVLEITEILKNIIDFYVVIEKDYHIIVRPFVFLIARLKGYKHAYVYYSYSSLVFAKVLGFKTYFWHCYWNAPRELLLILCLAMTNYLVTGTKSAVDNYRQRFGISKNKIKILPSWIDLKKFQLEKITHKGKTVLFYPRLTLSKGSDWLPEIIKKVKNRNIRFKIINGDIPNSEIPKYLAAADLYILPSRGEGLPRTILEAMAAGVPFVTTNIGGINDITTPFQKQCLINFKDTAHFSEKINEILLESKLSRRLSQEGKRKVRLYSIKAVAKKFVLMLE